MKLIDCCSAIGETLPTRKMLSWILQRRARSHGVTNQTIVLAMKLSFFLLTAAFLQVGARGVAQNTVTYSGKKVSLQTVFKAIEKQTGYSFFYNDKVIEKSPPVSIKLAATPLEEALDKLLKDQPLSFTISGKTIFIKEKEETSNGDQSTGNAGVEPPPVDVRGRVVNENGEPVLASVMVKGTNIGTTTNADGYFELKGVDDNAVLVITASNIETREIGLRGKSDLSVVNVKMKVSPLDEMQVIAYGKTSRRFNTGNTTTVKGSDISSQPVSNVLQALVGRVPGLQIIPENNIPGGGITVRIQGQNSISNGNDPLYVVDGVPYVSQMLPTTSSTILGGSGAPGAGSGNPLSYLNPNDIESIDVLKDADATAIYGSRAANGAILITTKKGKAGKTNVSLTLQNGWAKAAHFLPLMNTEQYLKMRHQALKNDGTISPASNDYDINGTWDTTSYTDWQKKLAGGTAHFQNFMGSVSGGALNTQFVIGASYRRQSTIFSNDFADKKASVHFNINHSSIDKRFNIQLTANYLFDNNLLPSFNPSYQALNLAPNAPSIFENDGKTLNWAPDQLGRSSWTNPFSNFLNKYQNNTKNLISNAILGYELVSGLSVKTSLGYHDLVTKEFSGFPLIAIQPENRPYSTASAIYSNSEISSWIIEPQVIYEKTTGKNELNAFIGTTFQQKNSNGQNLTALGFNNDNALQDIASATSIFVNSSIASIYKYNAIFGRFNYNFNRKYIINYNIRRDGSSRFGSANKFHTFSSIGMAWIMSEEEFFKRNLSFISFAKLRGSYGTTGNDQINDYLYYNLFSPTNYGIAYQNGAVLSEKRLTNPYLQWEETKKIQFGVDLGIIKDRFLIKADFARNRSSNQLIESILPGITGYTSVQTNFPATVQNTSLELSVEASVIKNKNVSWSINGNITLPKNKLVNFPDLANSIYADFLVVNQPLNVIKAYHYMGVDPQTGKYQFEGSDGKATTTPQESDRRVLLNTSPKFYGGFGNTISISNFQLVAFFQFASQKIAGFSFGNLNSFYPPGRRNVNQPIYVLDSWQSPGDNASVQKYSGNFSIVSSYNNLRGSDAYFENASFIRLQNLSLSYQLPLRRNDKKGLPTIKTFIECQNLFTITKFKGLDPESPTSSRLRSLTVGAQVGL